MSILAPGIENWHWIPFEKKSSHDYVECAYNSVLSTLNFGIISENAMVILSIFLCKWNYVHQGRGL